MTIRRVISTACLSLGVLSSGLLAPGPARAQALLTRERVEDALLRTDQRIESAEMLVAGADNAQAEAEFAVARDLQQQARAEFARGESRYRAAMDLTLRARGRADRAIALVKGLPDPDRVFVQVERTREILDRARDRLQECEREPARALLRAASDLQRRAEFAVSESRHLAALQFTLGARERVFRALRLCDREVDEGDSAERALARTAEVIERARTWVGEHDGPAERRQLERAEAAQAQARERLRGGQPGLAIRLTLNARATAHRIVRASRGRP
jgi:hypothetical protein